MLIKSKLFILVTYLVYALALFSGKLASGYDFLSFEYISFLILEFILLFIYAVFWQNVLGYHKLSVAFSYKSFVIVISMILGVLYFDEVITMTNVIGVGLIIMGLIMVNKDEQ